MLFKCHLDVEHDSSENLIIIHIAKDMSNEAENHFLSLMKNDETVQNNLRIERNFLVTISDLLFVLSLESLALSRIRLIQIQYYIT